MESSLKKIKTWNVNDVVKLMDYVELQIIYNDLLFKKDLIKNVLNEDCLQFQISTGGISENENIIDALLKNESFKNLCYYKWVVGGHYVFRINLKQFGYIKLTEYAKQEFVSRQYIHKIIERFDVIKISDKKQYIRLKK